MTIAFQAWIGPVNGFGFHYSNAVHVTIGQ
jgi:hypothetical protein